ncbi:hypothetical protein HZA57_10375 [Candidatus Poribacteria bacterium]|nr:hypothetical protein [Candidatus Poribacteria bacterium]
MRKGLQRSALGVLAAALLGGTVFAEGPTISQIPTVIITDKMNAADVAANPGNEFDYVTDATQNIFRFTDAIDLASYVNYEGNTPAEKALVNYLFTEADFSMTQRTGAAKTIAINGLFGEDTIPTDVEVNAANRDIVGAGELDFRNNFYTPEPVGAGADPGSIGVDGTGNPLNPEDYAFVTMFVADEVSGDPADLTTFAVITSNDPAFTSDGVSAATTVFTPVECFDVFDGWLFDDVYSAFDQQGISGEVGFANQLDSPPNYTVLLWTNVAPGKSPTPVSTPGEISGTYNGAPTGTNTVSITTTINPTPQNTGTGTFPFPGQYGYWQSADGASRPSAFIPVTEGNVYMARWTVSSAYSTTADIRNQQPIRFRMGNSATDATGVVTDELNTGANHLSSTVRDHRSYFYANSNGNMMCALDVIDFVNNDVGQNVSLSKVEVYSFDRNDLTGESVVFDNGLVLTSGDVEAGEPLPNAGGTRTDFAIDTDGSGTGDTSGDWTFFALNSSGAAATARPMLSTGTASDGTAGLFITNNAPTSPGFRANNYAQWGTEGTNINSGGTAEAVAAVPNDRLVFLDVWASSPNGSTANNKLGVCRIQLNTSSVGGPGGGVAVGRTAAFNWDASNTATTDGRPNALAVNAKRFTVATEPQVQVGTDIDYRIELLHALFDTAVDSDFDADNDPDFNIYGQGFGTVVWERVQVVTYDVPADAGTITGACL